MDVKTLAKSKRAHTQNHSKRPHASHTNQKAKAPSSDGKNDAAGNANKPLGKQVGEKPHRSQGASRLPSNWDRYEEEFEDPSVSNSTSQPSDVILPKSKGSDYSFLIAEAQSQSRSQSSLYLDSFTSLDDVMPGEFNQGLGPMLSVRGEGILSWIGDDNFVVEDKTAATHEASFLSLNLHALAEQLAKIDLSQRLFIEADLLPPELCTEGKESAQMQTCHSEAATTISENFSEKVKIEDQNIESTSSSEGSISVNYIDVDLIEIGKSSQNEASKSTAEFSVKSVLDPQKKPSTFEAADAEEELDMLLDSFGETKKILISSDFRSNNSVPVSQQEAYVAQSPLSRIGHESSKTSLGIANLDDALDDLLEETSNVMNQNDLSQSLEEKTAIHVVNSSASQSGTKSKVLDEFDSWLDTI